MIYSDFRALPKKIFFLRGSSINFYGLKIPADEEVQSYFEQFQSELNTFQLNLTNAIAYDSRERDKMLKHLDFLHVSSKMLEQLIAKYEIVGKFLNVPGSRSADFDILGYCDSYSQEKMVNRVDSPHAGYLHFLVDQMTLKYNLATCLSRMSSRMDLNWNEITN